MFCARRSMRHGGAIALFFLVAACAGDNSTGLHKLTTQPSTPSSIVINPSSDTLGVGQSRRFGAVVSDADGMPVQRTVLWTSANPTIASVSASGDVTALTPGIARIVAASAPLADTATVVVRAQDLIVEPTAISIAVGERVRLMVSRPNGTVTSYETTVAWKSSDESVARVATDGTLSAVGVGDVILTATVNGTQGSAIASVRAKDLSSLRIGPTTSSIYTGATQQMAVTAYDDNGAQLPLEPSDVKWTVSDSKIAAITSDGRITGAGKGSTVVSARMGNKQATASVNVLPLPAAAVAVSLGSSTLEVGQTTQATAVVTDANGGTIASPVLAWQSSNPALATVTATGLVTAVARGSVTISAVSDGKVGTAALTIATKAVASVAVTPNPAAALQGQTAQLTATAKDAQGSALPGKTFTWTTANTAVATVSSTGVVTSIGPGSTTITASSEGVSGTATFSTTQLVIASVTVTPTTASILPGQDLQLTATATDASGAPLSGRVATWASSNPTVATVSSSGKVTAIARGSANITATMDAKSASAAVAVSEPEPPPVASITVTLNAPSITVGQSTQAVAVLKDANGNTLTGRAVTWTSEAPSLATVSASGLVAAIGAGTATITASAEGKTGNTTIVIQPAAPAPVASVALSATSTSMSIGESQAVTVVLRDAQGNVLSGRSISWSSSNLSVMSVAPSGIVTALGGGTATVTATSEGKSGTITFTVAAPVAPVASVSVTAPTTTLSVGQSTTATATLKDGHGAVLTGRTVSWSSSAPNVATVSSTGVVTGVAGGSAVISASSEGKTGSLPFQVTTPGGAATVSVTLSAPALTVGQTTQAAAVARDANGNTLTGTPSWSSSNTTVATVSGSGLVSAISAGTAEIRASLAGTQGSASLSVSASGGNTVTPTPAELPRSVPSFTIPSPSRTYTITTDLQRALDTAKAGDEIRLQGTFTGNFVLPAKTCGTWITIRSVAEPPAPGVRVTPTTAAGYARVVSPNNAPAIKTANPTCGWRLLGFAITGTLPQTSVQYGLLALGDGGWRDGGDTQTDSTKVPSNLVIDRMYIYGSSTLNSTRCLALNSGTTVIRDSWISECHAAGFDSQAINGWNGPGPYLIENNRLEGAGENIMFGGADPGIAGMVPSDITIRRNHFIKPLSWKGGPWSIKNLFELKTARRLLVEGNVFENVWPASQEGMAIVIKSNANGCQCTFLGTTDLTFRYNIVRNAAVGLNLQASDDSYGWTGFTHTQRMRFEHNLFTNIGSEGGRQSLMLFTHDLKDVEIANNTMVHAAGSAGLTLPMAYAFGAARRVVLRDNVFTATTGYAFHNSDNGSTHTNALNAFANDGSWSFTRNVVGGVLADYVSLNPSTSWYPSTIAGVGLAADYSLGAGSPYKGRGLGGVDPGADIAEVTRRTAGAVVP